MNFLYFMVMAYDKDNDVYEELYNSLSYEDALNHAKIYTEQCKAGTLRRSDNNEPFDWIQIENSEYPGEPIWISD